jgi:hypothetical protein
MGECANVRFYRAPQQTGRSSKGLPRGCHHARVFVRSGSCTMRRGAVGSTTREPVRASAELPLGFCCKPCQRSGSACLPSAQVSEMSNAETAEWLGFNSRNLPKVSGERRAGAIAAPRFKPYCPTALRSPIDHGCVLVQRLRNVVVMAGYDGGPIHVFAQPGHLL